MSKTTTTINNNKANKRRVCFGSCTEYTLAQWDPAIKLEEIWYSGNDLKTFMRNDIINMLKRCKRKKLEITALGDDENGEEECTDRGLEMYFPGQLTKKKKARQQFSIFVLSNYEVFQEICDTTEEIEEELKTYASALSQPGKKEALRLAEQDAFKARKIYEEMLKQYNSNSSSSNNDTRCERSALNQLNSVTFAPAQAIAA